MDREPSPTTEFPFWILWEEEILAPVDAQLLRLGEQPELFPELKLFEEPTFQSQFPSNTPGPEPSAGTNSVIGNLQQYDCQSQPISSITPGTDSSKPSTSAAAATGKSTGEPYYEGAFQIPPPENSVPFQHNYSGINCENILGEEPHQSALKWKMVNPYEIIPKPFRGLGSPSGVEGLNVRNSDVVSISNLNAPPIPMPIQEFVEQPKQNNSDVASSSNLNVTPMPRPIQEFAVAPVVIQDPNPIQAQKKPAVICDQCGKSFRYKSLLTEHLLLHSDQHPFKCETCGSSFSWKGSLTRHNARAHKKFAVREFKCRNCQMSFRNISELNEHLVTHFKERPFQCLACGRAFTRKDSLKKHIRSSAMHKKFAQQD